MRAYYQSKVHDFLSEDANSILGKLADAHRFDLSEPQKYAWKYQIQHLKESLINISGTVYFEFEIPRMGKRVDVLLIIDSVIYIVEYKVGATEYFSHDVDQAVDYALDMKNFHKTSHNLLIAPILIATDAAKRTRQISFGNHSDKVLEPTLTNSEKFVETLSDIRATIKSTSIDSSVWEKGQYCPTPTIMEAALALYKGHRVEEISRNDAGAKNIQSTSLAIEQIIRESKTDKKKSICFVTGVPGAGKTLVGLNIANKHMDKDSELYSVFLSGNGPLVKVLKEALSRDRVEVSKLQKKKITKKQAESEVGAFIQNIHHFRDDCLKDDRPPIEHVTIFDEAQRAWNLHQTVDFMKRKKGRPDFNMSEPTYLISCMDRHLDWAVVICLVGGGQEINTGEAGISEWLKALEESFKDWSVYVSPNLGGTEYQAKNTLEEIKVTSDVNYIDDLHLATSMRSFRSERVSNFVKCVIDLNVDQARSELNCVNPDYPIRLSRSLEDSKKWIRRMARGSESYGVVVSSQAERLKPLAYDVKSPMNEIHWFLGDKDDVRSSYYMESVATEFHIQGLEIDWAILIWDADFRYDNNQWVHRQFRGNKWMRINKPEKQQYQKNAYRVLMTRARQGMLIVVPEGNDEDPTRLSEFYDPTFNYLKSIQIQEI